MAGLPDSDHTNNTMNDTGSPNANSNRKWMEARERIGYRNCNVGGKLRLKYFLCLVVKYFLWWPVVAFLWPARGQLSSRYGHNPSKLKYFLAGNNWNGGENGKGSVGNQTFHNLVSSPIIEPHCPALTNPKPKLKYFNVPQPLLSMALEILTMVNI